MTAPRPDASIEPAATPLSSLLRPRNNSSGVASLLRSSHPLLRRISISTALSSSPPTRWNGGGRCQLTLSRGLPLARVDCPRGEQLQRTAAPYIGSITLALRSFGIIGGQRKCPLGIIAMFLL